MIVLRELAPAKINLYLHVTGKRADGYHLLDSLVVFADMGDKLEVSASDDIGFAVTGAFAKQVPPDNSVIRASRALRAHAGIAKGAKLTLHKNLPVGAGIGGGSADAGAALRLLMRFWQLEIPPAEMHSIAVSLGADVAACLRSGSLYMSGIGEEIDEGPAITQLHAVLVNPGKTLLTADIFAAYKGGFSARSARPQVFATSFDCVEFLRVHKNDLQETALTQLPEIRGVLSELEAENDCVLARMSGSGPTCFGLFFSLASAQACATRLAAAHPDWWIQAVTVG